MVIEHLEELYQLSLLLLFFIEFSFFDKKDRNRLLVEIREELNIQKAWKDVAFENLICCDWVPIFLRLNTWE